MNIKFLISLVLWFSTITCNAQNLDWASKVGSRSFPTNEKVFSVNKYGAVGDGKTNCTSFIQKAIEACTKKGGGIVAFEKGTYLTGALFLKDNVHLKIDKEVLILGSEQLADYPEIDTRIAGIEMKWPSALINVISAKNVAVSGEGIINARGNFNWDIYWKMRK